MVEIRGGAKLEARLRELAQNVSKATEVRVGFLEGATEENGTPVAMIAAIQNFGAPKVGIPARPFFTNMVKDNADAWGDQVGVLLNENGFDARTVLTLMGEEIKGELREAIINMNEPPNSPVTNLLKQRFPMGGQTFADVLQARADVRAGVVAPAGKPLVQSGKMLDSIGSEVR
jgi:phage gpG-like protein